MGVDRGEGLEGNDDDLNDCMCQPKGEEKAQVGVAGMAAAAGLAEARAILRLAILMTAHDDTAVMLAVSRLPMSCTAPLFRHILKHAVSFEHHKHRHVSPSPLAAPRYSRHRLVHMALCPAGQGHSMGSFARPTPPPRHANAAKGSGSAPEHS